VPDPSTLIDMSAKAPAQVGELEAAQNLQGTLSILRGLFTGDHLNASGGPHFSHKNFGRDSAISMLFLLDNLKHNNDHEIQAETRYIIEKGIYSLVHWQGSKDAKLDGRWRKDAEEKGKIHHEAGPVDIDRLGLVKKWQEKDDRGSDMLVYFGSVDATPLYVRLVSEYIKEIKRQDGSPEAAYKFLLSKVPNFRGGQLSVAESLIEASAWIQRHLQKSELGFIEYCRLPGQEQGIPNQVWKDSLTSYVHTDGELANTKAPIASIEVQALTYDALIGTADLFETDAVLASSAQVTTQQIKAWRQEGDELRQRLLKHFWLAPKQRFAQAIDRNPRNGEFRPIETASSNELHLLNSRLFDDMDEVSKKPYIQSLVYQALSGDFLTDIGIRCRAKSQHHLINFTDYHGSWAVWPWESHWIALGLRHQGLAKLADQIDIRVMNSFIISGQYAEFYLVNPESGLAYYRFVALEPEVDSTGHEAVVATNIPDTPQTWSAAAAIDIHGIFTGSAEAILQPEWLGELQQAVLPQIKQQKLLASNEELAELRKKAPVAVVDLAGGKTADEHYYAASDQLHASLPALAA
jgi:glycogen debranching enzyme